MYVCIIKEIACKLNNLYMKITGGEIKDKVLGFTRKRFGSDIIFEVFTKVTILFLLYLFDVV